MPRHDPVPPRRGPADPRAGRASPWAGFRHTMGWMALAGIVAALLALIYLKSLGGPVTLHMQLATILGVFFTVIVGAGLMALVFLSSRSGHDDEATFGDWNDDDRDHHPGG